MAHRTRAEIQADTDLQADRTKVLYEEMTALDLYENDQIQIKKKVDDFKELITSKILPSKDSEEVKELLK